MTLHELQSIVRRLANQGWCRYWINFFDRKTDVMMAIQVLEASEKGPVPKRLYCLEELDFELYSSGNPTCEWIYVIQRTNDDGSPFESKLF